MTDDAFLESVGISIVSLAASVLVLNPLVNGPYDRSAASIIQETLGVVVVGSAALASLVAPVLFMVNRAIRGRFAVPRFGWAIIGSLLAMLPWVTLSQSGGSILEKVITAIEFLRTAEGLAAWGPYLVGGGVLGWNAFRARRPEKL